jgi:hypothetical protein
VHAVYKPPEGVALPPVERLLTRKPDTWQGMRIDWPTQSAPVPVFLARFVVEENSSKSSIFLFGARYDLDDALVDGQSFGSGHFVEFFVTRRGPDGEWNLHRLLQRNSVTYSATDEAGDYVDGGSVNPRELSLDVPPRWKPEDAEWPTDSGVPMSFVGQVRLPETPVTRAVFTWGTTVYLFWKNRGEDVFKLVMQDNNAQTAEEHYKTEE